MDNYIPFICLFLSVVSVCASRAAGRTGSDERIADEILQCENICRIYEGRVCSAAPPRCGGCMPSYIEHDGICLERYSGQKQDESSLEPDHELRRILQNDPALAVEDNDAEAAEEAENYEDEYDGKVEDDETDLQVGPTSDATVSETSQAAGPWADKHHHRHRVWTQRDVPPVSQLMFISVVAGFSVAGLVGLIVAGICYYRLQKNVKAVAEADYPAYGVTGPIKERMSPNGDRKLAQSAQMYHYQHQKQQMIAMEKNQADINKDGSEADSDEDNLEGDYTVYECPGLAPTGEMEVKNPLFSDDGNNATNKMHDGKEAADK